MKQRRRYRPAMQRLDSDLRGRDKGSWRRRDVSYDENRRETKKPIPICKEGSPLEENYHDATLNNKKNRNMRTRKRFRPGTKRLDSDLRGRDPGSLRGGH